ncbi:hypothetical protein KAZ92_03850 [Candidatus Gracilibacteria bacterium]|nr:hypothetical protein [Candidatus Gracilibacteria bacterium]
MGANKPEDNVEPEDERVYILGIRPHQRLLPVVQKYRTRERRLLINAAPLIMDDGDVPYIENEIREVEDFIQKNPNNLSAQDLRAMRGYVEERREQLVTIQDKEVEDTEVMTRVPRPQPQESGPRAWLKRILG